LTGANACDPMIAMDLKGRILAIDYGDRNIGLACSDEAGITVQPLPSIPNLGRRDFLRSVRTTIREMDIRQLVLGMPLNMNGTRGEAFERMQHLMKALQDTLQLPTTGMDERLSTVEAVELWKELSPRRRKKYRTVDSLAAALILERYLKEM
jgi:putative Holliday junction resolvase